MAKTGKKFKIHGAFKSKEDAKKRERQHHGFIIPRTINGHKRYVVLSKKKKGQL